MKYRSIALGASTLAACLRLLACSNNNVLVPDDLRDAGNNVVKDSGNTASDAGAEDSGALDTGVEAKDAAVRDAGPYVDKFGDAGSGSECEFNRNCAQGLRCECANGACACAAGARGRGVGGVDTCQSGNDCGSSVCNEYADASICSDECASANDCGPRLPKCIQVFGFSSNICSR
jgi:hypothetical protein